MHASSLSLWFRLSRKWPVPLQEELHPEQKKRTTSGGLGSAGTQASMMLEMLDTDKDGRLSKTEFQAMAAMAAAQQGAEESQDLAQEQAWKQMDKDSDGFLTPPELEAFLQAIMSAAGPGGMGAAGATGASPGAREQKSSEPAKPKASSKPKPKPKPAARQTPPPVEDEDDELPSHDEL